MCSFDVRRSSLPAYCHSPSVIRDKKKPTGHDQAGVIRCARGLPRQSDKPDASGWPEVISLSEHTVDVLVSLHLFPPHTPSLDRRSLPCVPSPPRSLSVSKIAVCVESQRSKNLSQLKGKRKGRLGSCLWSWVECLRVHYVCRVVSAGTTLSSLQVNLLNLRNLMHLILHLWGLML